MNRRKKIIILSGILFLIMAVIVFVFYFKSHGANKLKGSVAEVPANSAFTDINFYSCVVNSYNKENGTNYYRNHKLSDEQLASIETMDCRQGKYNENYYRGYIAPDDSDNRFEYIYFDARNFINTASLYQEIIHSYDILNFSGIEKLTGLKTADFNIQLVSYDTTPKLDLTNNKQLTELSLNSNYENYGGFEILDVSQLTNLKSLNLEKIKILKLSGYENLTSLENLSLTEVGLENYDFLNSLTSLKELYISDDGFNNLSLITNLNNIESLSILGIDSYSSPNSLSNDSLKLSELSYLGNLKKLIYKDNPKVLGDLPVMANLEKLILEGINIENINFNNFPNINFLDISENSSSYSTVSKLSDLNGITSLSKLKYLALNLYSVNDFSGIELLTNLESLYSTTSDIVVSNKLNNVKQLYGDFNDYSMFPNLTELFGVNSDELTPEVSKKVKALVLNDLSSTFINNLDSYSFNNLEFYNGSIVPKMLSKLTNIKELYSSFNYGYGDYDFSNNTKLEFLSAYTNRDVRATGFNKLNNLKYLVAQDVDFDSYEFTSKNNLETVTLLNERSSNDTKIDIDLSKNNNLKNLFINDSRVTNLDLPNNNNLELLYLNYTKIKTLDLSNCNKLAMVSFRNNLFQENNTVPTLVGSEVDVSTIKFPKHFQFQADASELFSLNGSKIVTKIPFSNKIDFEIYGILPINYTVSSALIIPYSINVISSDISIKKYNYDPTKDYLFTGTDTTEKTIISNIKQKGMGIVSAAVDRKKLKLIQNKKVLKQLDIINLSSSKYEITDDSILYNGVFDVNNISISNAQTEVVDNVLKIKYKDEVVKEYNLVKKNNLLGDVNGDGEITISDMVMQYKHVKYIIDLDKEAHFRADINNDDDVSISDVPGLYKYIKGQTDDLGGDK